MPARPARKPRSKNSQDLHTLVMSYILGQSKNTNKIKNRLISSKDPIYILKTSANGYSHLIDFLNFPFKDLRADATEKEVKTQIKICIDLFKAFEECSNTKKVWGALLIKTDQYENSPLHFALRSKRVPVLTTYLDAVTEAYKNKLIKKAEYAHLLLGPNTNKINPFHEALRSNTPNILFAYFIKINAAYSEKVISLAAIRKLIFRNTEEATNSSHWNVLRNNVEILDIVNNFIKGHFPQEADELMSQLVPSKKALNVPKPEKPHAVAYKPVAQNTQQKPEKNVKRKRSVEDTGQEMLNEFSIKITEKKAKKPTTVEDTELRPIRSSSQEIRTNSSKPEDDNTVASQKIKTKKHRTIKVPKTTLSKSAPEFVPTSQSSENSTPSSLITTPVEPSVELTTQQSLEINAERSNSSSISTSPYSLFSVARKRKSETTLQEAVSEKKERNVKSPKPQNKSPNNRARIFKQALSTLNGGKKITAPRAEKIAEERSTKRSSKLFSPLKCVNLLAPKGMKNSPR